MAWQIPLTTPEATQQFGKQLATALSPGGVILLWGELGAGKTTLVQGLGEGLGIEQPIVSPTFTLINEYCEGKMPLYHLDLYRLENASAIAQLFPETYWEGEEVPPGLTVIEWAQQLPYFPDHYLQIELLFQQQARYALVKIVGDAEIPLINLLEQWMLLKP